MSTMYETDEEIKETEARRQALASSIAFQNLGEPVQKLLFALNAEISEDELSLLSTITVLQLAKVFDMMSSGEDPEKILAWLRRTARRNAQGEDPYQNERKRKVYTGASRDPISFYKEIERRNLELQERHRKAAEEREKIRLANLARREEERRKRAERLEEEQRIAQENGENTTALERLKEKDRSDLTNTFERFVNKQSTYDNSAKAQDGEWWKKEEHRRDYEKLGKKGKKWKAVQENGNIQAPEPELAIREDWYKSQTWWKGDKYRNDWYKTRDVAWWKETPYIRDWQENGAKGTMWTAADESSGFNCKGREHAAELSELEKRIEWYKVNGPKGVQTLWSAMAEGSIDRCTVDEKHERVDYYKNGDWWRCDDEYRRFNQPDSCHEPLKVPGPSGADREWWKSDKYRADFENKGELWKCANEVAIVQGKSKDFPATESEQERRAQWYRDNWWKAPRYMDDYEKNGQNGFLWRSRTESDAKGGAPKLCKDSEAFLRQIWYDSHERRVWWKDNEYQRDYEMHGDKGEKWTAACEELAILSRASEHPASEQERKRREDWYKQNWWKADRYSHDYLENINGVLWKGTDRTATIDIDWWKQPLYRADFMAHNAPAADVAFWQAPEVIEDFQKHGGSGKMWCAVDAFAAASHAGDKQPASAEEIAKRKEWYGRYWWRGLRYQREWAVKGMKGSLWLSGEEPLLGSRGGTVAPPEELRLRQEAYAMHGTLWRALTETEAHTGSKNLCQPRVALERMLWYRANWWKSEEMLKDFEANGKRWKSVTQEDTTGQHEVGEEERKLREKWFALCSDMFFWQQPEYIDDYFRKGKEGALWCAKNAVDARRALGRERPASTAELQEREEWYKKNHWKSLSSIEKFVQSGSTEWQCTTHGSSDKVSGAELDHRKMWLTAHAPCNEQEQNQRKNYHRSQLTDLEVGHRFAWLDNKGKENKRINKDELNDLLQMLNQNQPATPEQIAAVEAKIQEFRTKGLSTESPDGSMSQEEIINAVAETGFYVPPTDQELQMNEEEIFEELEKEEAARLEEEAAFLAMEAEEERKQAGGEPEQDDINDEEAAFLAQQEAEKAPHVNEDDLPMSDEQIKAWEKFNEDPTPADSDKNEELAAQREAERAEEERRRKAEEEAWKQEAVPDDEPEEEGAEETTLDAAVKEDLEEQVNEDENAQWREDDDDDEKEDAESVAESATPDVPATSPQDPKPEPPEKSQQWKLPLPQVTNPQFLKAYFMVIKYVPKGALVSGKQKRVWVVDHFTRSFYNMDTDGTIRKEHAAHKLLQLEKSTVDLRRVRMMFLDASHSYELLFPNAIERERFYETASAIRPSIRVFAPSLTNPDASVECTSTTIDGVGPNTVVVQVPTLKGNIVDRELTGECKINASRSITEAVSVWVGTLNLSDAAPPKDANALEPWMPRGKYDVYAVGIQEGSYQKEDNEWFNYVQKHLGKDYLTLATMRLWDIYLIVLARKKNLLRITNVEGSTKATSHKSVCGTKGGVGICLRIHETSLCFVTCQLAARPERTAMRNTNIQEIIDSLQLSLADVEFTQQFNHVFFFGDFNYRVELENDVAEKKIQAQDYAAFVENCQLNQQCRKEGLLHGFMEPPVNFRPTYRFKKGTLEYNMTQGMIPSYTDRVLIKSMPNAAISCTSYGACEKLLIGEHLPVSATFTIRALRPCISCFETVQKPKVRFTFRSVSVTEYTGVPFTKAQLTMHTNFSEGPHVTKPFGSGDELHPSWAEKDIPPINSVNHLVHYLELQHILIVLRDASEKNPIKAARGSACLPLAGAVLNKQGVPQEFPIDIRVHGKRVGTLKVELTWVPG